MHWRTMAEGTSGHQTPIVNAMCAVLANGYWPVIQIFHHFIIALLCRGYWLQQEDEARLNMAITETSALSLLFYSITLIADTPTSVPCSVSDGVLAFGNERTPIWYCFHNLFFWGILHHFHCQVAANRVLTPGLASGIRALWIFPPRPLCRKD